MQHFLKKVCQKHKGYMKKLIVAIMLLGFSCKKNNTPDCSQAVCPAVIIAGPFVNFNFSDKITNQDLFFSASAKYQLKDVVIFKKKNIVDTIHIPFYIDSLNIPKHFVTFTPENPSAIFIQIKNEKADTIEITSKPIITNCCISGYIFSSLKLNGKLICSNCDRSLIIDIKK